MRGPFVIEKLVPRFVVDDAVFVAEFVVLAAGLVDAVEHIRVVITRFDLVGQILIIVVFQVVFVGVLIVGMGAKTLVARRRIRRWPTAKGTMLEAKLSSGESMSQDEDGEWESSSWFAIAVLAAADD